MNSLADLKTLWQLTAVPVRGRTHAERLEHFYQRQADHYDAFRRRLLHGRRELVESLPTLPGAVWYDIGAGTGENLEFARDRLASFSRIYLVDLCPSLLAVARRRVAENGWSNVELITADAETFAPPAASADVVTCSYSLSMIPDWLAVLEHIARLLRPGGTLGVADFHVSRKYPPTGHMRHGWLTRTFWPAWFALDNVYLHADLLPYLTRHFHTLQLHESRGRVPFLCGARVPYFVFLGQRRSAEHSAA